MIRVFGISIFIGVLIAIITLLTIFSYQKARMAKAATDITTIQMDELQEGSAVEQSNNTVTFSLFSDSFLYDSSTVSTDSTQTVYDVLNKPIVVEENNVKGVSTTDAHDPLATSLLPKNISDQLELIKRIDDHNDEGLKKIGKAARRSHIKFGQKIGGVPVFGSQLAVHTVDNTKVYAMTGSLVKEESVKAAVLSESEVSATILQAESQKTGLALQIQSVKQMLFNPALIGLRADDATYPVAAITLSDTGELKGYHRIFYVSLVNGAVLLQEDGLTTALNRNIYDCARAGTCNLARAEGSTQSGIVDADRTFDYFETVYSFYRNTFGRDSYDNLGSVLKGFVNVPDVINASTFCPNGAWLKGPDQMLLCPGWAVLDIIAHELTHGVTNRTAGFIGLNQSGALDEAIADMMAVTIDDDWDFGEDLSVGALRRIDNPATNQPPSPDRLFDSKYYCGEADNGGVHINMSIPTKAFYLMSTGGQFNGCAMNGIGKEKSARIWYQALTRYLGFTSNFRDANNAVMQSCADLYGAASGECTTTRAALQATEMDQQPLTTDTVTRCVGAVRQIPVCALPITNTTTPTPATVQCTVGDANCDESIDLIDYEMWRREFLKLASSLQGDFDHDGVVNLVDYEMWRRSYLRI